MDKQNQVKILVENTTTYRKSWIHSFTTYVFEYGSLVKMISEDTNQDGHEDYREQTHNFGHWLTNVSPEEFLQDRGINARIID